MQITKTKDEKKPNMDCVNLLTSVLIYYPEISKISIEPDEKIYINYRRMFKVLSLFRKNASGM